MAKMTRCRSKKAIYFAMARGGEERRGEERRGEERERMGWVCVWVCSWGLNRTRGFGTVAGLYS